MDEVKYYLIWDQLVGKMENGQYYLFENGEWNVDKECIVSDHLVGYDPSEPPDSPYGFGDESIMDEIDEITCEEAMKRIGTYAGNNKRI